MLLAPSGGRETRATRAKSKAALGLVDSLDMPGNTNDALSADPLATRALPANARLRALVVAPGAGQQAPPAAAPKPQPTASAVVSTSSPSTTVRSPTMASNTTTPFTFTPVTGSAASLSSSVGAQQQSRGASKSSRPAPYSLFQAAAASTGPRRSHTRSPSSDWASSPQPELRRLEDENVALKQELEEKTQLLDAAVGVISELQAETEQLRSLVRRLATEVDSLVGPGGSSSVRIEDYQADQVVLEQEGLESTTEQDIVAPQQQQQEPEEERILDLQEESYSELNELSIVVEESVPNGDETMDREADEPVLEAAEVEREELLPVEESATEEPQTVVELVEETELEPEEDLEASPEPEVAPEPEVNEAEGPQEPSPAPGSEPELTTETQPEELEEPMSPRSQRSDLAPADHVFFTMTEPSFAEPSSFSPPQPLSPVRLPDDIAEHVHEDPLTADDLQSEGIQVVIPSEEQPVEEAPSGLTDSTASEEPDRDQDFGFITARMEFGRSEGGGWNLEIEEVQDTQVDEQDFATEEEEQPSLLVEQSFAEPSFETTPQADTTTLNALDSVFLDDEPVNDEDLFQGEEERPPSPDFLDRLPSVPDLLPESLPAIPDFEPVSREQSPLNSPRRAEVMQAIREEVPVPKLVPPAFTTMTAFSVPLSVSEPSSMEQLESPAQVQERAVSIEDGDRATSSPSPTKSPSKRPGRSSTIVGKLVNKHRRRTMVPAEVLGKPVSTDDDTI